MHAKGKQKVTLRSATLFRYKPEKAAAPYGVQRLSLEENEELVGMGIT